MTREDVETIGQEIDALTAQGETELAAWRDLLNRSRELAERIRHVHQAAEGALHALDAIGTSGRGGAGTNDPSSPPPGLQTLRDVLERSKERAQLLLDRASAHAERFVDGDVSEALKVVESAAVDLADLSMEHLEHLGVRVEELSNDLMDDWPTQVEESTNVILDATRGAAEILEADLREAVDEACTELAESLARAAESVSETVRDSIERFTAKVNGVIDENIEQMQGRGRQWTGRMEELKSAYAGLGRDVETLGQELETIYSLVMDGMQTSGIGMNAAAASLTDLQSIMRGVA
jgi:hypothetical protein